MRGADVAAVLLALLAAHGAAAQTTRAERSGYRETSSYDDVLTFLDSLQRVSSDLRVETLATSPEGRRVPYVITGHPLVLTPADAHRAGKPIVYLQANIHAGEVEGKEAAQMLLRDLTVGPLRPLLQRLTLLVVPIYNVDGNERWGPGERNRPGQNGPELVGQNPNGQGLNLNRDYVKMEAPETRGSTSLIESWDPDLFIDLHTTNGSYHGYVLTYAPGLNPNPTPSTTLIRDRVLPLIQRRMLQKYGEKTFSYGNFRNQNPDSLTQGWETYDARPRFGTNWMGLRGRPAILSEGYSNAPFEVRVHATYDFVHEILDYVADQGGSLHAAITASEHQRPDSVIVRSVLAPPIMQEVIAEITTEAGEGAGGYARRKRTGIYKTIRMPVFDRFTAAHKEASPAAYLIPPRLTDVVALLRRQGIAVDVLTQSRNVAPIESFAVESLAVDSLFEGHRTVRLEGHWNGQPVDSVLGAGWYRVSTNQPLGTFASYLLEPASEDGIVTWNLLDRELRAGGIYPIHRVRTDWRGPALGVP
jgi:hypothetical protein